VARAAACLNSTCKDLTEFAQDGLVQSFLPQASMVRLSLPRLAVLASALSLGASAFLAMRLIAPATEPLVVCLIAFAPLLCCGVLALASDDKGISGFWPIVAGCAAAALGAGALIRDPKQLALLFGFGSLGLMLVGGYSLAKSARWRTILRAYGAWAVGLALIALLGFYCLYYLEVSRNLMFGDFMYRRMEAIVIGSLLDQGQALALVKAFIDSMKDEYSLLPTLAPGLTLSLTSLSSRFWYQGALVVFYAAPAYFALGVLAIDLAGRHGFRPSSAIGKPAVLALAIGAALVAYPTGVAVVAGGMPDIGGIVLVVAALRLSDRLTRLLSLPSGHEAMIGRLARRVSLALALCLFGMFLFRRWYAFAAVGVCAVLALEVVLIAAIRRARFRWRDAIGSASLIGLLLVALCAPILIDWLPNSGSHDYVTIYAAYRKDAAVLMTELCDWYGAGLLLAAVGCALLLSFRSSNLRLLRLTWGSCLIAALLFLRVQSPAIHHVYLLTSAFAASIGAVVLILFQRWRPGALIALVGLAAFTLTPAVSSWAPDLAPTAGRPPAPRSDLAELARLRAWIEANAAPNRRYCVLGSSYTINDALVDELWQMSRGGLPNMDAASRINVGMPHVDTRDGPPNVDLIGCAFMLVGDPVQTHLVPEYQQTVIIPASEMLEGIGIGANYRRSGEVFNLEKDVKLVVFDRVRPLDDTDIRKLQDRWQAVREGRVDRLRGTVD
jgi:hypothetical protein